MKIGFKSPKQIVRQVFGFFARLPMPGHWRWRLVKLSGVKFERAKNFVFIGDNVHFDSLYPELISIGDYVHITTGCILLTHYLSIDDKGRHWEKGNITIEDGVFIGANTIITKPVTIGCHSIIGAGAIVTKNIPPYEVWGGNPAKCIKKIEH